MRKLPRKRRTRQHVLADLSVNHVERHVLRCGWTVERMIHDYGIDLELFTFDKEGAVEEGTVHMQLKASEWLRRRPGAATVAVRRFARFRDRILEQIRKVIHEEDRVHPLR